MRITNLLGFTRMAKPLTSEQGRRILERDHYQCQYCGLDGMASFENSLIMTVDFIRPRARGGKNTAANLATACRPCNVIKGHRVFPDMEQARTYVRQRRTELQHEWEARIAQLRNRSVAASS